MSTLMHKDNCPRDNDVLMLSREIINYAAAFFLYSAMNWGLGGTDGDG